MDQKADHQQEYQQKPLELDQGIPNVIIRDNDKIQNRGKYVKVKRKRNE